MDDAAPRRTSRRPAAGRTGSAARRSNLVVLAALLQFGSIVTRGLAADRWPLGNMYEFTSRVLPRRGRAWLVVLRR